MLQCHHFSVWVDRIGTLTSNERGQRQAKARIRQLFGAQATPLWRAFLRGVSRTVALQDISVSLSADAQLLQQRLEGHINAIQPQECPSTERINIGTIVSDFCSSLLICCLCYLPTELSCL